MTKPPENYTAKLKHFKSATRFSGQQLVVEYVQEGSESDKFLKKMEFKRRSQITNRMIDMRGKVPGECRAYKHKNRLHFMDDKCIHIFEKSLNEFDGQYTVGVYEDVINAEHTNKARHKKEQERMRQTMQDSGKSSAASWDMLDDDPFAPPEPEFPVELTPFGYYQKRREPRLTYIMDIEVVFDDYGSVPAKTKDLSCGGLRVTIADSIDIEVGSIIKVNFTHFEELPGYPGTSNISYRILDAFSDNGKINLRMVRTEPNALPEFNQFTNHFIELNQNRYKLDIQDNMTYLLAKIQERHFIPGIRHVSFFLRQEGKQHHLEIIGATERNSALLQEISMNEHHIDLSALLTQKRLSYLLQNNPNKKVNSILIFTFIAEFSGKPVRYSACNFEFLNTPQKQQFLYLGMTYKKSWRVYKLQLSSVFIPEDKRISEMIDPLKQASEHESTQLTEQLLSLTHKGSLFDITDHYLNESPLKTGEVPLTEAEQLLAPFAAPPAMHSPAKLIQLGLREHRSEQRYLHQTDVEMTCQRQKVTGHTLDFSIKGIRIELDQPAHFHIGEEAWITLTKLQKQLKDTKLSKMPYVVVAQKEQGKIIMLERDGRVDPHAGSEFFRKLIRNNSDKLPVCLGEKIAVAEAKLLETLVCGSLHTVPFFLSKDPDKGSFKLSYIASSDDINPLIWFFHSQGNHYDFAAIANTDLVNKMVRTFYDGRRFNDKDFETEVYVYKEHDLITDQVIMHYASARLLETEQERLDFIKRAAASEEFRFLQVRACARPEISDSEFDREFEFIRANSKNQARTLKDMMSNLVGVGDMIDVTAQVLARDKRNF